MGDQSIPRNFFLCEGTQSTFVFQAEFKTAVPVFSVVCTSSYAAAVTGIEAADFLIIAYNGLTK
jgi:hypothetical protein